MRHSSTVRSQANEPGVLAQYVPVEHGLNPGILHSLLSKMQQCEKEGWCGVVWCGGVARTLAVSGGGIEGVSCCTLSACVGTSTTAPTTAGLYEGARKVD